MATTVSRRYCVVSRPRVVVSSRRESVGATHTVVALRGELDSAALNTLVDTFEDAIKLDDSDVIVDLADVDFISAAWIGTLVHSRSVLRAQHRDLTLRAPSQVVHRLLELCGLSYLVEPVDIAPS
jgi:anti-anti-sigma factor